MTDLSPILPRLAKLVPRLASNADGEVVATVRAIDRTLRDAGFDWHDVTSALAPALPPPERPRWRSETESWGDLANWCRFNGTGRLSLTEAKFVADMSRRLVLGGEPTPKQAEWLRAIYARLKGGAA
ncbi:hypothetical protein Rumeso_04340 [Rubellimicrobium mesophilum DSM 19309]|uniref:Uncharacterized protein n=1 Tax=Rubellimicrobium mesophilum DSM 19309 TaxID=442562 RepID=A0A017HHZ2_9RHOB|nr:hypothetical protein [Rubellimicrobium mesophilum]EYD74087.1 hypothetical protein Rumeso_04340 [Rubellimicrobium mesophilum DSM 19309]